jgi:transcriptional regulator with XRE-family HTH domain
MHIGQVIRSLREQKGWSQEKLALDAGMGTSHVSRIERGERRLPTIRLDALAAALGTTPAAIYAELEGLPPPPTSTSQDENLQVDYSPEAIELRKTFRKLPLPGRRLVVDFARMLAKQASPK